MPRVLGIGLEASYFRLRGKTMLDKSIVIFADEGANLLIRIAQPLPRHFLTEHRNVELASEVYQDDLLYRLDLQWRPRAGSRMEITQPPLTARINWRQTPGD